MMSCSRFFLALIASVAPIAAAGCGTRGSNPPLYAEVRFTIRPTGASGAPSMFTVDSLSAGGVTHPSLVGQQFLTTDRFEIVLENAAPPYQGIFTKSDPNGADMTVTVSVNPSNGTAISASTSAGNDTVVLSCVATASGAAGIHCKSGIGVDVATLVPPNPEVRFNLCAPLPGSSTCFSPDDSGVFGQFYTGTVGDSFITHLLNGYTVDDVIIAGETTPSIYFIEGARDSADGVFQSISHLFLRAELLVNGDLTEIGAGNDNLVLRTDIPT